MDSRDLTPMRIRHTLVKARMVADYLLKIILLSGSTRQGNADQFRLAKFGCGADGCGICHGNIAEVGDPYPSAFICYFA